MSLLKKNKFALGSDREKAFLSGRSFVGKFIVVKILATGLSDSHFAVFVPTRVAVKAAMRNKLRRKVSDSLRGLMSKTRPGYDVIILVKTGKLPSGPDITEDALTLWKKSGMLTQ